MVKTSACLFLGSDELRKDQKLDLIAQELFPAALRDLNYSLFYGDDRSLSAQDLQEAFCFLPTQGARKRLLVVRLAHKLKKPLRDVLVKGLKDLNAQTVLVVDMSEPEGEKNFIKALEAAGAEVVRFKEEMGVSVFDLGRAILERRPESALKILGSLLLSRDRAEKIMGGLSWQWERFWTDKKISEQAYASGVRAMLDADRKLKSFASAYAREHAILEFLVVKLCFSGRG